jgi:HNH endonuclease
VSGTLRYEVLKRAVFRCELCGVSAEDRALEVDHIVPRNLGGSDDLSNLQALCYSCNAMKRDRDTTDFRGMAAHYRERSGGCIFCDIDRSRIMAANELMAAIKDAFPVTDPRPSPADRDRRWIHMTVLARPEWSSTAVPGAPIHKNAQFVEKCGLRSCLRGFARRSRRRAIGSVGSSGRWSRARLAETPFYASLVKAHIAFTSG